jgi:hypothetical protein
VGILYSKTTVSPLDLLLDSKNPRFITSKGERTQEKIRNYLISQEDVLPLAKSIAESNSLLPGERIVVCREGGKWIVLEGNRRACVYQMYLNRNLIPEPYVSRFPATTEGIIQDIRQIEVDIMPSREEARRFLAIRHIVRPREWSTIAKMRFCYEDYLENRSIAEINERSGLAKSVISKYIHHYKILQRGLDNHWSESENEKLNILLIEPDKLLRLFDTAETRTGLSLYYDEGNNLRSYVISDDDLSLIIQIWTRKAFIDNEINTRTSFGKYHPNGESKGACIYIASILDKYFGQSGNKPSQTTSDNPSKSEQEGTNPGSTNCRDTQSSSSEKDHNADDEKGEGGENTKENNSGGGPKTPLFFGTLNWKNVDQNNNKNKGIIAICCELYKISHNLSFVNTYPICTAFIIRALIEHSLKYYARKNGYWAQIMQKYNEETKKDNDPNLGFIIRQYNNNIKQWISDNEIRRIFDFILNKKENTEKLNLVIHSPESYLLSPRSLLEIPDEGLLRVVNYFLE